jgi:Xaa-Pro aminopeptidase
LQADGSRETARLTRHHGRASDKEEDGMAEFPVATTPSPGIMGVDWEDRVDFERLRQYRLARVREQLEAHGLGALLLFETSNIRYATSTAIGYWAFNKGERWCLVTREGRPKIWDFGSAAKAHRLQLPHMYDEENSIGGNTGLQGAIGPEAGLHERAAREIAAHLRDAGVANEALGVDMAETAVFLALQKEGLHVTDGQQAMMMAREIKSPDEIVLLTQASAMVDGVYQDIFEMLKPGVRESDVVALAHARLFEMGSEFVEAINSIAGERCSPHPHVFSDRMIRPGDQAYFDIIHAYNGYRTCYYRTFVVGRATQSQRDAFKQAREWMDAAIERVRPGNTTDMIAQVWPRAEDFGFADEMDAFGLQFGHGVGIGLHERPIISRLNSLDDPIEIKEGMYFALETYAPADDGHSAARIEEMMVVTADGPLITTLFPCEELMVANEY